MHPEKHYSWLSETLYLGMKVECSSSSALDPLGFGAGPVPEELREENGCSYDKTID